MQIAGGINPIAVMHPSDYETLCLLRTAGPENQFVASSTVVQTSRAAWLPADRTRRTVLVGDADLSDGRRDPRHRMGDQS
jgi:hypothetical protein